MSRDVFGELVPIPTFPHENEKFDILPFKSSKFPATFPKSVEESVCPAAYSEDEMDEYAAYPTESARIVPKKTTAERTGF